MMVVITMIMTFLFIPIQMLTLLAVGESSYWSALPPVKFNRP